MDKLEDIIKILPQSQFTEIFPRLEGFIKESDRCIIVLDDDPTGCQTLYGIPVLFQWDRDILEKEMVRGTPLFFLMTNSRSMTEDYAVALYREIGQLIREASEKTGRAFSIISRSDSTLRGHYPAEPDALQFLYEQAPIHCIIPAFFQGGRYTIGDIHYVQTGDLLVPASQTPSAEDKVFGFSHSNLKKWVEEKTSGRISHEQVFSFGLEELRMKGPEYVEQMLIEMNPGGVVVVNAATQNDLDIFALGALEAEKRGSVLLYRTAASFLNSFGAIPPREPLEGSEIASGSARGGLFIVGSYVPRSTAQMEHLMGQEGINPLELEVSRLLLDSSKEYINESIGRVDSHIKEGRHVLLYTSRELVYTDDPSENLAIGKTVSDALVTISREIRNTPAFIVAKGGITSHDIASKGLRIKRAIVAGPALPGVPVLIPDDRPDLRYIVFPGNVGENDALSILFNKLKTT
jgi:uncharacterized protein YgbK (DUF1537 family)